MVIRSERSSSDFQGWEWHLNIRETRHKYVPRYLVLGTLQCVRYGTAASRRIFIDIPSATLGMNITVLIDQLDMLPFLWENLEAAAEKEPVQLHKRQKTHCCFCKGGPSSLPLETDAR